MPSNNQDGPMFKVGDIVVTGGFGSLTQDYDNAAASPQYGLAWNRYTVTECNFDGARLWSHVPDLKWHGWVSDSLLRNEARPYLLEGSPEHLAFVAAERERGIKFLVTLITDLHTSLVDLHKPASDANV